MKIKTISRTKSFGNYENISMCAEVEDNELISNVVDYLEGLILGEIARMGKVESERNEANWSYNALCNQIRSKESELASLNDRIEKAHAFCEKMGIKVEEFNELPF